MPTEDVRTKPHHIANTKDLPEPARLAFLLARRLSAFSVVFEKTPKTSEDSLALAQAVEKMQTTWRSVREIVVKAGVQIPEKNGEDWTPAAAKLRAHNFWKAGLLVLQRREAMGDWHPEQIDLSSELTEDPILSAHPSHLVVPR